MKYFNCQVYVKLFKFDQSCIQFICLKYVIRIHKASILFILDSPETTDQFVTPLLHRCAGYDGYVPRFLRMLGLRHLSALAFLATLLRLNSGLCISTTEFEVATLAGTSCAKS